MTDSEEEPELTVLTVETFEDARDWILSQREIERDMVGVLYMRFSDDPRVDELAELIDAQVEADKLKLVGEPAP